MKIEIIIPYESKLTHKKDDYMEQDYLCIDTPCMTHREAVTMIISLIDACHQADENLFRDCLEDRVDLILRHMSHSQIMDYIGEDEHE